MVADAPHGDGGRPERCGTESSEWSGEGEKKQDRRERPGRDDGGTLNVRAASVEKEGVRSDEEKDEDDEGEIG
ncbi:unnamed protein product [Cutaneotrichosporon oleaginosum]